MRISDWSSDVCSSDLSDDIELRRLVVKVAFIGLGRMGQAMARRLLEADHDLVVYNRTPEKLAEIASLGAGVSKSIGEAARHGGVVVTMLADDTALAHVGRGPGGLVENLPQGGVGAEERLEG